MLTRRDLLAGTALLTVAACDQFTTQVPLWVSAIQAIGQETVAIMPQLTAAGLSGDAATHATSIIAQIQTATTAITTAATAAQGQSTLVQIETYVNALAPYIAQYAALVPGGSVIGLIVAALPAIELALNLAVNILTNEAKALAQTAPKPAAAVPGRAAAPLSPEQALQLLLQRAQS